MGHRNAIWDADHKMAISSCGRSLGTVVAGSPCTKKARSWGGPGKGRHHGRYRHGAYHRLRLPHLETIISLKRLFRILSNFYRNFLTKNTSWRFLLRKNIYPSQARYAAPERHPTGRPTHPVCSYLENHAYSVLSRYKKKKQIGQISTHGGAFFVMTVESTASSRQYLWKSRGEVHAQKFHVR